MSSSSPPRLTLIVAATASNGIGRNGTLPWRLPGEMKYFARTTTGNGGNAVLMGRKSWDSIPPKFRPLKDRINIVISRSTHVDGVDAAVDTHLASSLDDALSILTRLRSSLDDAAREKAKTFVIGGAQIYRDALTMPAADRVLLTRIKSPDFGCDTFFPPLTEDSWHQASHAELCDFIGHPAPAGDQEEKDIRYEYQMFQRRERH